MSSTKPSDSLTIAPPISARRPLGQYTTGWAAGRAGLSPGLLLASIAVLALVVRLPLLAEVPRFTDETDDMLVAYALANGQALPLVNVSSYIGVLLTYLIAPAFKLLGPRLEVARFVVALFGVAALVPTYLLGRRLGGPWAGLVAAGLLAASAPHALVSSRIAWSHSLTPLFTVLAVWLLLRAVEEQHGPTLAGAGVAAGLALHTHPTIFVLLPAGGLYLFWKGRSLLRTRWALLGAVAVVLTNLNLLLYNLQSRGESVAFARLIWGEYATRDRASYRDDLFELLGAGARLLGAVLSDRFVEAPPLFAPVPLLLAGLGGAGLLYCALRGQPLPLLLVGTSVLLFPAFLSRYEPVMQNGRYIMPLLPICLAATGTLVAALAGAQWTPRGRSRAALAGVLVMLAVGWHLAAVQAFLSASVQQGLTNERYYRAEAVLLALPFDEEILVDGDLVGRGTGGGGDLLKQFRYLLVTNRRPYRVVERPARPGGTAGQERVIVLRWAALSEFGPNTSLTPLLPAVEGPRGANFGIYRVRYPL